MDFLRWIKRATPRSLALRGSRLKIIPACFTLGLRVLFDLWDFLLIDWWTGSVSTHQWPTTWPFNEHSCPLVLGFTDPVSYILQSEWGVSDLDGKQTFVWLYCNSWENTWSFGAEGEDALLLDWRNIWTQRGDTPWPHTGPGVETRSWTERLELLFAHYWRIRAAHENKTRAQRRTSVLILLQRKNHRRKNMSTL